MPLRSLPALLLILALVATLPACTMWSQPATANWKNATAGEQLERLFWDTVKARNWTELERHIAPGFILQSPAGPRDRAQTLERLRQLQLSDYSLGDVSTQLQGNTLIVTYTITRRGSLAGQPLPDSPVRMMSVWQQLKRGWLLIAHSDIPAASASPSASGTPGH